MYRCKTCHSTAVEGLGWIDLNSPKLRHEDVLDLDEFWCEACDQRTEIYFKNEPNEEDLFMEEDDLIDDDNPTDGLLNP